MRRTTTPRAKDEMTVSAGDLAKQVIEAYKSGENQQAYHTSQKVRDFESRDRALADQVRHDKKANREAWQEGAAMATLCLFGLAVSFFIITYALWHWVL